MERVPLRPLNSSPQLKQAQLVDLFKRQITSSSSPYASGADSVRVHCSEDEQEQPAKKKRKADSPPAPLPQSPELRATSKLARHRRATSVQDILTRNSLDPRCRVPAREVLHSKVLASYVTHDFRDVYRCLSTQPDRHFANPFAVAASYEAKRGGRQIAMVATEEGYLSTVDVGQPTNAPHEPGVRAHCNSIFDLKWRHDDRLVATASGDQTVGIIDVEAQKAVLSLVNHVGTLKQVSWDPINPFLLASGGRDGCIRIWDIRQPTEDEDDFDALVPYCNNLIQNAHGDKLVRRDPATRTNTKSVTSVAYLEHRDNLIASSGSFESVVKVWDLRKCLSRRINPPALQTSPDFSFRPGVSKKPNGVCSILLSADKTELYAIATNAKCVALDAFDVSRPEPLKTFDTTPWHLAEDWQGSFMTELRTSSFYVRLALSPDGRTLATGTQEGNIWMWDTRNAGRNFNDVHVKGHSGEICGLDFSSQGMISCSDDSTIRMWRPDVAVLEQHDRDELGKRDVQWQYHGCW